MRNLHDLAHVFWVGPELQQILRTTSQRQVGILQMMRALFSRSWPVQMSGRSGPEPGGTFSAGFSIFPQVPNSGASWPIIPSPARTAVLHCYVLLTVKLDRTRYVLSQHSSTTYSNLPPTNYHHGPHQFSFLGNALLPGADRPPVGKLPSSLPSSSLHGGGGGPRHCRSRNYI